MQKTSMKTPAARAEELSEHACSEELASFIRYYANQLTQAQSSALQERLQKCQPPCRECESAWCSVYALLNEARQPSLERVTDDYRILKRLVLQQRDDLEQLRQENERLERDLAISLQRFEEQELALNSLRAASDDQRERLLAISTASLTTAQRAEVGVNTESQRELQMIDPAYRQSITEEVDEIRKQLEAASMTAINELSLHSVYAEISQAVCALQFLSQKPQTSNVSIQASADTTPRAVETRLDMRDFEYTGREMQRTLSELRIELTELKLHISTPVNFEHLGARIFEYCLERKTADNERSTFALQEEQNEVFQYQEIEERYRQIEAERAHVKEFSIEFPSYDQAFALLIQALNHD